MVCRKYGGQMCRLSASVWDKAGYTRKESYKNKSTCSVTLSYGCSVEKNRNPLSITDRY